MTASTSAPHYVALVAAVNKSAGDQPARLNLLLRFPNMLAQARPCTCARALDRSVNCCSVSGEQGEVYERRCLASAIKAPQKPSVFLCMLCIGGGGGGGGPNNLFCWRSAPGERVDGTARVLGLGLASAFLTLENTFVNVAASSRAPWGGLGAPRNRGASGVVNQSIITHVINTSDRNKSRESSKEV